MILAFLITTLILFILNLSLNIATVAIDKSNSNTSSISTVIAIFITLLIITWNIFSIISYIN